MKEQATVAEVPAITIHPAKFVNYKYLTSVTADMCHCESIQIITSAQLCEAWCMIDEDHYPLHITSFDISELHHHSGISDRFNNGLNSAAYCTEDVNYSLAVVNVDSRLVKHTGKLIIGMHDFDSGSSHEERMDNLQKVHAFICNDIDVKTAGHKFNTGRGWNYRLDVVEEAPLVDPDKKPATVPTLVVKRHPDMTNVDFSDVTDKVIEYNTTDEPWLNIIQSNQYHFDPSVLFTLPIHVCASGMTLEQLLALSNLPFIIQAAMAAYACQYDLEEYQSKQGCLAATTYEHIGTLNLRSTTGKIAVFEVDRKYLINVYLPADVLGKTQP